MASGELRQVDGALAGAWIKPALEGDWGGRVKNLVPQIYEAYARVFHPASEDGKPVTWEEVARRLGTVAHREMQWHALVGSWDSTGFSDSRWAGEPPGIAEPPAATVDALCAVLAEHTGTPERVYFGISTIHGGTKETWPGAPVYEQTHREWVILRGPLRSVDEIEMTGGGMQIAVGIGTGLRSVPETGAEEPAPAEEPDEPHRRSWSQSPNLIWPEDRAWFVQSEYDFDSTLLGGSRALIDALLAAPDLEVWEVDSEVSLTENADKLNPVPDPPPDRDDRYGEKSKEAWLAGSIFETLSGEIASVTKGDEGLPDIEVIHPNGLPWHLVVGRAELTPADPTGMIGISIQTVQIDDASQTLRCRLTDGSLLEAAPRPDADEDHPAWRVDLVDGMSITRGYRGPGQLPRHLATIRNPSGAVAQLAKAPVSKTGDSRFESWLPRLRKPPLKAKLSGQCRA
jgi:hypothetical protein